MTEGSMDTIIGKDIEIALEILSQGGLVGIPTETVYGLAGNGLSTTSVLNIFAVKNRPFFDPLILHTNSIEKIERWVVTIPEKARVLAHKFWPGPLTLLLDKKECIPDLVSSGLETVAFRIPKHPLTLELLERLDFPLAAPSANPFGYISPTTAKHVNDQLGGKIPYILEGGQCEVGVESTIIHVTKNGEVHILRKGGLDLKTIEQTIGAITVHEHSSSKPEAPGMLKSHYAPRTPLFLTDRILEKEVSDNVGYIFFSTPTFPTPENSLVLSERGNTFEAAKNLFFCMRSLDEKELLKIIIELVPEEGLGPAINDRLRRAASLEVEE